MTALDALVAEALAAALASTPALLGECEQPRYLNVNYEPYVRDDVVDAALAHLAARVVETEDLQRRTEQMWRAANESADEWRNRCESSSKRGRDMVAALDSAATAGAALTLARETMAMMQRDIEAAEERAGRAESESRHVAEKLAAEKQYAQTYCDAWEKAGSRAAALEAQAKVLRSALVYVRDRSTDSYAVSRSRDALTVTEDAAKEAGRG